jgi:hypothetical protein
MDKLREGEDDQSTRFSVPTDDEQSRSRYGSGKGILGHGDKAREGAHRTEALQEVFSVDTQRGMIKHEVWGLHRAM